MLPDDLLIMIFGYLGSQPEQINQLCLVNRQAYVVANQILYNNVSLHTCSSIELFCNTVIGGSQSSSLVKSLWLGPESPGRFPGVVALISRIRIMLQSLICLKKLTLTPMAKSFGELFNGLLDYQFKLRYLTVSYHTQPSFIQFIESQPSITHLQLFDPDTEPPRAYNLVSNITQISDAGRLLPNIEYLSADPRVLASVLVGRPITHVEVTVGACLSNEPEELRKLVSALTRTTTPIRSITHTLRTVRIHLWGNRFLQQLKETSVGANLKDLAVHLPQIMVQPVSLFKHASARIRPIAHISQLFAKELAFFQALKSFELSLDGFRLSDSSAEEVTESFGDINEIGGWQSHCGTLQRVILYGTELK